MIGAHPMVLLTLSVWSRAPMVPLGFQGQHER
jgi:hypothetical protein